MQASLEGPEKGRLSIISRIRSRLQRKGPPSGPFLIYCNRQRPCLVPRRNSAFEEHDRDEALDWFSEKLRLMLTFEGDSADADHLLDEWPEGLLAHVANPTIPIFGVSNGCTSTGMKGAEFGQISTYRWRRACDREHGCEVSRKVGGRSTVYVYGYHAKARPTAFPR